LAASATTALTIATAATTVVVVVTTVIVVQGFQFPVSAAAGPRDP
jgi:hypothetical protein